MLHKKSFQIHFKIEWRMMTRTASLTMIHIEEAPDRSTSIMASKLCSKCFTTAAQGHLHNCFSLSAVANLILLVSNLGSLQAEQVASGINKAKMETDKIASGESLFCLLAGTH